jgi:DNA damage-binding protein 1
MPPHTSEQSALLTSATDARKAFNEKDMEASRKYHEAKRSINGGASSSGLESGGASEDGHQSEGGLLKPIIFGGLDGILTSFAIVAGAAGGGLSPTVVLVLGFSNIFADALRLVTYNGKKPSLLFLFFVIAAAAFDELLRIRNG